MSITPSPQAQRKLPVLACINHTLNSTLRFRDAAVRIGLPWIAVLALVNLASMLAGRGMSLAGPEAGNSFMPDLFLAALSIIAASSIAVNWHRYILRDETPKTLGQAMRLDAPVWRYAGYTVFTLFIVLFPVIVLLNISLQITILLPLVLLASFFGGIMFMRLSVALPAKALEQPGFGLRQAMEATRGNMGSFAGIILVNAAVVLATLLAMGLLLSIVLKLPSPISVIAIALVSMAANLFITIFGASLLSSLYGFFVEKRNF